MITLALGFLLAAAPTPPSDAELQEGLPPDQQLVQTLHADLDHDGKEEWIAIGEPRQGQKGAASIAIFSTVKGKVTLRWAQHLKAKDATKAGAMVRTIKGFGPAVLLVAAEPDYGSNDSTFFLQVYGWQGGSFRGLAPEIPKFVSQGGFSIEERDPKARGEEIVVWNYLSGEGEAVWDQHRYATRTYHWRLKRWVGDDHRTFSTERYPTYTAAAKAFGIKGPDLRRQIPQVAQLP